jgi:uncharacterized protein (DUF4415 family)
MTRKKPDHISNADWEAVDSPELTEADFAKMRPARDAAPELVEMQRRRGRPPVAEPKVPVNIRLSADVVDHFKAQGPGWQTRIDEALRDFIAARSEAPMAVSQLVRLIGQALMNFAILSDQGATEELTKMVSELEKVGLRLNLKVISEQIKKSA